jgi:hypothetical protein
MTRWFPVLLIFWWLALWPASGQQTAPAATEGTGLPSLQAGELRDTEPDWKIGIAAFDASRADAENAYLAHSIPLLLRERLETVPAHHLDQQARLAVGRAVLRDGMRKLFDELVRLRKERDELLFGSATGRADKVADYDRRIAQAIEDLNRLKETGPEDVQVAESKPLHFVESGEGSLMEAAIHSAAEASRSAGLDLLIWGRVEQLQQYLYVEAYAFDAAQDRVVFRFRDAAGVDGVQEVVAGLGDELARLVWGRDWASLEVQTEPAGALVWVNDEFVGRAPVFREFVVPGTTHLRVESPGYRGAVLELNLEAYARTERVVRLEATVSPPLALTSDPSGAAAYVGADWVGTTPLELPRPDGPVRLLLRKEGYLDTSVYLDQSAGNGVSVTLLPASLDPRAEQRSRRDSFYRAFGLFALSVPLPFFFWGFAGDYAVGFAGSLDPRLWSTAEGFYWAYVGALAVSGGLFANMLVRLLRYVRSADRRA